MVTLKYAHICIHFWAHTIIIYLMTDAYTLVEYLKMPRIIPILQHKRYVKFV